MKETLLMAAIAMVLSFAMTPLVRKLAFAVGAVDKPNARKVHARIMPRMGGLAIFLGFVGAVLYAVDPTPKIIGLLVGVTIIVAIGVIDDLKEISPKVKLLGQIAAAAVVMYSGVMVKLITNPFGPGVIDLGIFSIPVTLLWIVGVTNAVNLIDGLDGLAAGISAIASVTLGVVAFQNDPLITLLAFILAGSILGFMPFNFNPAKIFMGDSGSLFLGYTLAVLSIMGLAKSATALAVVIPVLVLGVPILDTAFAIFRRWSNQQPIFQPDKAHLHHCFLANGLSHRQTVLAIWAIHATMSGTAVALNLFQLTTKQGMFFLVPLIAITLLGADRLGVLGRVRSAEVVIKPSLDR